MKYLKRIGITFAIMCLVISISINTVFALTEQEQKMADILAAIAEDTSILADMSAGKEYDEKVREIARKLKKLCDDANIDVKEFEKPNENIGWRGVADNSGPLKAIIEEAQNPDNEEQVKEPEKTKTEKEELEEKISEAMKGYKNKTTEELKAIDGMLKQYRAKYPSAWVTTNYMYIYAQDINEELKNRKDKGDYETALEEGQKEREEEQENLKPDPDPMKGVLGDSSASASHTPDEIVKEAENFLSQGSGITTIDEKNLKDASSTLYNILLSIGIFLAVGIGMYLGVKFMVSTAEDKAKVKEALIPYIVGCVVIFTAFIVWKMAILLLGGIA